MGGKNGKIAAKKGQETARFEEDVSVSTLPHSRLHVGAMGGFCACMRLSRCWRGWVTARLWN